jgi:hypothetical protein
LGTKKKSLIEIGSCVADRRESMSDPKEGMPAAVVDGIDIRPRNAINVTMEELAEEDRNEVERQLEVEMAEPRRKNLACFQKTRNGIVKKADMATTSSTKVNSSSLSLEDLVQLVDVSIASKYGADLTQFTCVVAEDMRSMLDAFKQDFNANLPRQVRALVQQISGEVQGKRT